MLRDSISFAALFYSMPGYYPINRRPNFGVGSDIGLSSDNTFRVEGLSDVYIVVSKKMISFDGKYDGAYSLIYG